MKRQGQSLRSCPARLVVFIHSRFLSSNMLHSLKLEKFPSIDKVLELDQNLSAWEGLKQPEQ